MSFKKQLEKILDTELSTTIRFQKGEAVGVTIYGIDRALTSIINLVDKEVIGEDEVAEGETVHVWKEQELESFRFRNTRDGLREQQRNKLRGE